MPNSLVALFRKSLADRGQVDPRDDDYLTLELGRAAEENNRELFDQYPDFAQEFRNIREANAPSLAGEAGRALKSGTQGLASTALGGLGLVTGSEYLKEKARSFEDDAAANAPTIATLEDVAPGEPSTAGKVFSKDALRYGIAKAGSVAPSIAESVGSALAGAALGTAAAPGPGTIAGAAAGVLEKSLVKAAIKRLLAKGVATQMAERGLITEATEAGIEGALKAGSTAVAESVAAEAAAVGALRGGVAANLGSSFVLNAGDVASEGADTGTTLALGVVSALPDTILPAYVLTKLFPGVAKKEAVAAGKTWLARNGKRIAEAVGVPATEFGQEYFQEAANVVAKNIKEGKDPLEFDDADMRRLREAGIAGAAGGLLAAPGVMLTGRQADIRRRTAETGIQPVSRAPVGPPIGSPIAPVSPLTPAPIQQASVERRVALMSPEQQQARLAELLAKGNLTPEEEQEAELLRAFVAPPTDVAPPAPAAIPLPSAIQPQPEGGVSYGKEEGERPQVLTSPEGTVPPVQTVDVGTAAPVFRPAATAADILPPTPAPAVSTEITPISAVTPPEPAAVQPVDIGPRNPEISTGTGVATPAEEAMIAKWKADIAAEQAAAAAPLSVPAQVPSTTSEPVPTETKAGAETISPAVLAPTPEEQANVQKTETPTPNLEQRLTEELAKPQPFLFGSVNEASVHGEGPAKGSPITVDLRSDPRIDTLTPEQANNLQVSGWADESSNPHLTRVGIVLEAPDGSYVMAGLLPHQPMAVVGGKGKKQTGPAVQTFAREQRPKTGYQKLLHEGGNKPALLADVIRGGYKLRAMVHFNGAPTKIWQRWANAAAYDASYAATERTTGTQAAKTIPTRSAAEGVGRRNALADRTKIQTQIDSLAGELEGADPARTAEINEEIQGLYRRMSELPEPRLATETVPVTPVNPLPAQSDRSTDFARVTARVRQWGGRVDVFAKTFLQQELAVEISRRLDRLIERYQRGSEAEQALLQPVIERAQNALTAIDRVRGVAYSAHHIALGLDDISRATLADFVTLLHEAGHAVLQDNPGMQDKVLRAVSKLQGDLVAENDLASERTGFDLDVNGDPEELIVQTLAQRLAEEGVPDAPNLARAILQWIKDLYYRLAMAVQSSFGREPDPQMALDWFENQLRRLVGGDYDYRFAGFLERLAVETPQQAFSRIPGERSGTPEGVTDFYDSATEALRQPSTLPVTRDAVNWNLTFATEPPGAVAAGEELEIPAREANARIQAAAINEEADVAREMYAASIAGVAEGERPTPEEWWSTVGRGDSPFVRLGDIAQQFPGAETARIGGEKMTKAMNEQAPVLAKKLLKSWQAVATEKQARSTERGKTAEGELVDQAKALNKLEANLRNADAHEAGLRDSFKAMIREMTTGIRRGLDTAFKAGALARAVREVEGLSEKEAIPAEYQRVFKAVLADEVPLFSYAEAIARLDMPLAEMTLPEIRAGVESNAASDPVLARLLEPRNKPLFVAMTALAKKNAAQMDLIALRRTTEPEEFLKVKAELDAIRQASPVQLRAMEQTVNAGRKAVTLADRIKRQAIAARSRLRRLQETIQEGERSAELLTAARTAIAAKIDAMETGVLPAPSEWLPSNGATYLAMSQDPETGAWKSTKRTVDFTPEGPARNPGQLLTDLAGNREYLRENEARRGSKTYELVAKQVHELETIDVTQKVPEIKRWWIEKFLLSSAKLLLSGGGAASQRALQMLQRYQFILGGKWHSTVEIPAAHWNSQLRRVTREAGMSDEKAFLNQIYEPVLALIENEPGLDEGPALREAVRAAKRRLTTEPSETFDEALKEFLRQTKAMSETFVKIAKDNGVFVEDEKLGELRHAVARGWLTVMRSMDAATVSTVLREMEKNGWKIVFKNKDTGAKTVKGFDYGISQGERVAGGATFASLDPSQAPDEEQAQARTEIMEDGQRFSQAIAGFFSPNVVRSWLEPFINKPGEGVFQHNGATLDPLMVQQAWVEAQGDVGRWIDLLGEKVGLEQDVDLGEMMELGDMGLEAEWRMSMLRQMESLFVMESRIAADANQTKGLFDATGKPPHLIMDARENNLLPPEHVNHAVFDPISSKNLLSTLAFHAAFGRNGESMNKAFAEIEGRLAARKNAFEAISAMSNRTAEREALAEKWGYTWKDLQQAANVSRSVHQGIDALKAQFGFNSSASGLQDVRGGLELLHFVATQAVNNPKTGLLNLLQPAQRALARKSLGATTVRDTAGAYGQIVKTAFGKVLENFGIHILRAARHAGDIGAYQGQAFGNLPWTVVADMGAIGPRGERASIPSRIMRTISGAQRKGGRIGFGESREFGRLNVLPIAGNIMHEVGLTAGIANGTTEARSIEMVVQAAMNHFAAHPEDLQNPTFRLTHEDIGQQNGTLKMDKGAYDYLRSKMVEYNIGVLENVARQAMERQTQGEPILTKDQVIKSAQLAAQEVDLQGTITTNPAMWDTNKALRWFTPLMGWPLRQMQQVHEAMRTADGRTTFLQAAKVAGIMAAWALPFGLAFTFLTDEYDDKILKKKTQLGRVSKLALIPGGAPIALAASDIPAKEQLIAMFQRLSRAGNIYGLGFDAVSSALAGLDPTSGQRPFSMDSRILAFSQLLNLQQAITNYVNSGFATTYANVERPLIMAMIGSGPLQAVDAIGAALGLDNQEMRIARRTNVNQELRTAGREVGLELRRGGGASVAPTPTSVWTREMWLAAIGGDRLAFLESYRRAVDAAREAGAEDPEKAVRQSWTDRNPLDVFRHRPDSAQLARMLGTMTDNGREAVQSAMRNFDNFTSLIAPSRAEAYQHQVMGQIRRQMQVPSMESLRRSMASQSLSIR